MSKFLVNWNKLNFVHIPCSLEAVMVALKMYIIETEFMTKMHTDIQVDRQEEEVNTYAYLDQEVTNADDN